MLKLSIAMMIALASTAARADRLCEGAVNPAACPAHRVYVASLRPILDTSPEYMKAIDPRYNKAMRDAGGGFGDGGSAGGASAGK